MPRALGKRATRNARPVLQSGSGCGFLVREAPIEGLPLVGHLAQERGSGEAGAELFGQLVAPFGGVWCANDVEPRERAAGPRGKTPCEDRTDIAFADVFEHALLECAHRLEHLCEHQPMLHGDQVRLIFGQGVFLGETFPIALPLALLVVVEEPGIGFTPHAAFVARAILAPRSIEVSSTSCSGPTGKPSCRAALSISAGATPSPTMRRPSLI